MPEKSPSQRLLDAQMEIGAVKKDKDNPFFHSKYADINDVLGAVKPILNKHGFTVWQPIGVGVTNGMSDGEILGTDNILNTYIIDSKTGEEVLKSAVKLPDLDDAQKMGGAITYYRRYALQALLSLEAEDDDGNTASGNKVAKKPTSQASDVKTWRKVKEENYGTCEECGSITERAIGVSKQNKQYNIVSCTKDKNHKPVFLDIDQQEFENTLSF